MIKTEGITEKAKKEDLSEILNLQKKAFKNVAEKIENFNIPPMIQTYESIIEEYKTTLFLKYTV